MFCGETCRRVSRLLRDVQAAGDEDFTLADPLDVVDEVDHPLLSRLADAASQHRAAVTVVLAAYVRSEMQLDAIIWAAASAGLSNRQIGEALEMRTVSVRRRLLAFQARLHGPAAPIHAVPA